MKIIKNTLKKLYNFNAQVNVSPLDGLMFLGSKYQGYYVPDHYLGVSSLCYCIGAGSDISLDVELVTKYGAQVFVLDPMPYALEHFNELVAKTNQGHKMITGTSEYSYVYDISNT